MILGKHKSIATICIGMVCAGMMLRHIQRTCIFLMPYMTANVPFGKGQCCEHFVISVCDTLYEVNLKL